MAGARACYACEGTQLESIVDFGNSPLADVLLRAEDLARPDPRYPLELFFCESCALVQLGEVIPPDILYRGDYPYYTSVSEFLLQHFGGSAEQIMRTRDLGPDSLVIEAASNDGYMLRRFAERGIPVLGVDPAEGPAEAARGAGVPTLCRFFDAALAEELRAEGKRADVLLANNVLNLVSDLNGFARALTLLLTDDGVAVLEVPYLVDLIDQCAFDNVFHQNVCYFSLTALRNLLASHDLAITDVERIPTFGGSLRVFIERSGEPSERAVQLLADEVARGADRIDFYRDFSARVASVRQELGKLIAGLKRDGQRIVAYGAAGGMATTLLTYLELGSESLDYAVDINEEKQGRYTVGSRLLIHSPKQLLEDQPDYVLLLAWNFEAEVMRQNAEYLERGGRFIIPIPHPRIA